MPSCLAHRAAEMTTVTMLVTKTTTILQTLYRPVCVNLWPLAKKFCKSKFLLPHALSTITFRLRRWKSSPYRRSLQCLHEMSYENTWINSQIISYISVVNIINTVSRFSGYHSITVKGQQVHIKILKVCGQLCTYADNMALPTFICRCCSNRSISLVHQPTAANLQQWHVAAGWDRQTPDRCIDKYYAGSTKSL